MRPWLYAGLLLLMCACAKSAGEQDTEQRSGSARRASGSSSKPRTSAGSSRSKPREAGSSAAAEGGRAGRLAAPAGEGGSAPPLAGHEARVPGAPGARKGGSAGRAALPSADPSCADFRQKASSAGFAAGSCGSLAYWTAARALREGYRASEITPLVLRGTDGLAGLVAFMPNESGAQTLLEVYRFDGTGACQERIGQASAELADARYELIAALRRGESSALQIACIAAQPCSSQLLWNGRLLDTKLENDKRAVQRIAITKARQLVLASFIAKPAVPMPELGVLVPGDSVLDLRLFDGEGLLVRQVSLPAPGRMIAIAVSEDDQLFVLSDELEPDVSDGGSPRQSTSRIDRFDASLLQRASWRAPASVQLRALDVNAGGQLALAGSIDEPMRAWVHVLQAANWSDDWPAPVIREDGGAFAVQIRPDGEVLAFGSATPADVWLMRYTRGQCAWPVAKIYRSQDQSPGRAIELRSAVQAQSDGSILASAHAAVGYCD